MENDREPRDEEFSHGSPEGAAASSGPPPRPASMAEVMRRHRDRILAIDGVEGLDQSLAEDGTDIIRVHITDESVRHAVPHELDGFPVATVITGTPRAY